MRPRADSPGQRRKADAPEPPPRTDRTAVHIVTHDGVPIGVIGPCRLLVLARPRKRWSSATREAWRTLRRWVQPAGVEVGPPSEPPEGIEPLAWAESILGHAVADRWKPPPKWRRGRAEQVEAVPPLRVAPDEPERMVAHPYYEPWPKRAHGGPVGGSRSRFAPFVRTVVRQDGATLTTDCGWRIPAAKGAE